MTNRTRMVAPRNVINAKQLYTFYILKELSKGQEIFGNKVLETFKNAFSTSALPFPVSSSTIYDTLYDLEQKGYVTSYWVGDEFINKRSKKMYRITDAGKEYHKLHIANYVDALNKNKSVIDMLIKMLTK
ncbi:PadR family transcriptional regulator [Clostridium tarantellae]|uniref:PadR family transcriptional regulator n=1 Tax=Clostridium tarantellae TaxID=39493 RepID=A0A6I1MK56_9CLOT|nr:PadR family transcriptional regulator [Clostridium tarantellae]MPQ43906.1 PadR family transcriptional regulator [Clostridium tarantellae]